MEKTPNEEHEEEHQRETVQRRPNVNIRDNAELARLGRRLAGGDAPL